MSRHDDTPITERIIPPSHPAIQAAHKRLIDEIDEWLDEDDEFSDEADLIEWEEQQRMQSLDILLFFMVIMGAICFTATFLVQVGRWLI